MKVEGFDILVNGGAPEARAIADVFLGGMWRVEAGIGDARQYDVMAPEASSMQIGEAWELARKMVEDPRVLRAEPLVAIDEWRWGVARREIEADTAKDAVLITVVRGGPLDGESLRQAIRRAVAKGIIIIAIARDRWPFLVYPAKYVEVMAADDVKAMTEAATQWLVRHDRASLLERYGPGNLAAVFRTIVMNPENELLPDPELFRAGSNEAAVVQKSHFADIAEYFPDTSPERVHAALVQLLNTTDAQLDSELEQFGSELKTHIATDSKFREELIRDASIPENTMQKLSRSLLAKMRGSPVQQR
ncbi:MAG TPA: hypothetical protein VGQ76_05930 [Thermoanaerobaculia bacterium]|jgi:hypothetical protein|nr:hypothetical protein [Thermoanaerobaculia bacterium]